MKIKSNTIPFNIPPDWLKRQQVHQLHDQTTTFDHKHSLRQDARGAWIFAKTNGFPFNVHLSFKIVSTSHNLRENVYFSRYAAHRFRTYCRRKGFPSNLIWTRTQDCGSPADEQVNMLVHIPDGLQSDFIKTASKWGNGIVVKTIGYGADVHYGSSSYTIIEWMFRATSNETQAKVPGALTVRSGPIFSTRSFASTKLSLGVRINHRKIAQSITSRVVSAPVAPTTPQP